MATLKDVWQILWKVAANWSKDKVSRLAAAGKYFGGLMPGYDLFWRAVNFVVSFLVVTVLFAMMLKILPDARIAWGDVWIGAAVTVALFLLGKFLIGLYLGRSAIGSTFGAAGSFAILLLWVYYSAQIFLIGAEFTQVYANRYGFRIRPSRHAVAVSPQTRVDEGMAPIKQPGAKITGEGFP